MHTVGASEYWKSAVSSRIPPSKDIHRGSSEPHIELWPAYAQWRVTRKSMPSCAFSRPSGPPGTRAPRASSTSRRRSSLAYSPLQRSRTLRDERPRNIYQLDLRWDGLSRFMSANDGARLLSQIPHYGAIWTATISRRGGSITSSAFRFLRWSLCRWPSTGGFLSKMSPLPYSSHRSMRAFVSFRYSRRNQIEDHPMTAPS
ncbi:hypothetical protein FA95DRAFT_95003 [Auriscalpium vulgare]|uniref:Uncharacterized protein n=1 Tax=Auriscalpium vulgare TaxID=40419 RepID=A0ACB8RN69_9AGAM|nr:hypothetical protein FA95DRAFT_95003 [Auriscalpium vulgare]